MKYQVTVNSDTTLQSVDEFTPPKDIKYMCALKGMIGCLLGSFHRHSILHVALLFSIEDNPGNVEQFWSVVRESYTRPVPSKLEEQYEADKQALERKYQETISKLQAEVSNLSKLERDKSVLTEQVRALTAETSTLRLSVGAVRPDVFARCYDCTQRCYWSTCPFRQPPSDEAIDILCPVSNHITEESCNGCGWCRACLVLPFALCELPYRLVSWSIHCCPSCW